MLDNNNNNTESKINLAACELAGSQHLGWKKKEERKRREDASLKVPFPHQRLCGGPSGAPVLGCSEPTSGRNYSHTARTFPRLPALGVTGVSLQARMSP